MLYLHLHDGNKYIPLSFRSNQYPTRSREKQSLPFLAPHFFPLVPFLATHSREHLYSPLIKKHETRLIQLLNSPVEGSSRGETQNAS